MAVHGANCFGYDKVSMDRRIDWVEENTDRILQVAQDPMADLWWAKEADSPWCFFAFAKEWEGFQRDGYATLATSLSPKMAAALDYNTSLLPA